PDAVNTDSRDLAVAQVHVPCAVGHDGRLDRSSGLSRLNTVLGRQPLSMPKRQALERYVLDPLFLVRIASKNHKPVDPWRDRFTALNLLAGKWVIQQSAVASQKPFTRCVERGAKVFQNKRS